MRNLPAVRRVPLLRVVTEVLQERRVFPRAGDRLVLEDERVEQLDVPVGVERVAPLVVTHGDDQKCHLVVGARS